MNQKGLSMLECLMLAGIGMIVFVIAINVLFAFGNIELEPNALNENDIRHRLLMSSEKGVAIRISGTAWYEECYMLVEGSFKYVGNTLEECFDSYMILLDLKEPKCKKDLADCREELEELANLYIDDVINAPLIEILEEDVNWPNPPEKIFDDWIKSTYIIEPEYVLVDFMNEGRLSYKLFGGRDTQTNLYCERRYEREAIE